MGQWDSVVTCFFIDTAHNIVEYLRVIHGALRPGGVWINLGPLLYHYANNPHERSIEPEHEVVLDVVQRVGFDLLEHDWRTCHYAGNDRAMLQSVYETSFFVAKKSSNERSERSEESKANALDKADRREKEGQEQEKAKGEAKE